MQPEFNDNKAAGRAELHKLCCLIVEDHPFQREIIAQILRQLNIEKILSAADGQEALNILKGCLTDSNLPDIIICDLNMPNIDGIELLRYLKQHQISSGLILTSGNELRLLQTAVGIAQEHGLRILGSLAKPIMPDDLQRIIEKMFDRPAGNGGQKCHDFSPEELRQAIKNGEFEPYFHPKISIETGDVISVEALARWNHPQHGVIGPAHFISRMEEYGMAAEITDSILRSSLHACSAWLKLGWNIGVAVNFSVMALDDLKIPDNAFALASSLGVESKYLTIELTESRGVADLVKALDILSRLRMKGFELSIDDFGAGSATIEQLLRIPFTELKLDRMYVSNAWKNSETKAILESVVRMAKELGLNIVAEGVETDNDFELIKTLECDEAQGYYFAKPMPYGQLLDWLNERRLAS